MPFWQYNKIKARPKNRAFLLPDSKYKRVLKNPPTNHRILDGFVDERTPAS